MIYHLTIHFINGKTLNIDVPEDKVSAFIAAAKTGELYYDQAVSSGLWMPQESILAIHVRGEEAGLLDRKAEELAEELVKAATPKRKRAKRGSKKVVDIKE